MPTAADDDLVPLTPAVPSGRWGNTAGRTRVGKTLPPPGPPPVGYTAPALDESARSGNGRMLNGFYCRLVTAGWLGRSVSGRVFRAYGADDGLILIDTTLPTLDPDKKPPGVATAIAGEIGGGLLAKAVGAAQAASFRAKLERVTKALDAADERAVRKHLKGDPASRFVPAAACRKASVEPLSAWAKLSHPGVARVVLPAAPDQLAALHLLSLGDLSPAIGEFTRLSGGTAAVRINWTAI